MKKTLSLILAVIMTVSLFAACGEKEIKGSEIFNPNVKVGDTRQNGSLRKALPEHSGLRRHLLQARLYL